MNTLFIKTRTVKDYIISVSLIVAGLAATVLGKDGIAIAGVFGLLTGIVLLFVLKSGWKNLQNGAVYKEHNLYFNAARKAEILNALENNPAGIHIDSNEQSTSLKLDVMYCSRTGAAVCQLSEYIPYNYEPCSKVYSYDMSLVKNLLK